MAKQQRAISNPLALAVLALLRERPMHPYEMAATMRERGKHHSIKLNYGSLYTVVDALERHGLIVPRETVREGRRPERTVYELTDAGRAKLDGWLRDLLRRPVKEYPQFEAGLSLMATLPPDEVVTLLTERVRRLEEEIARLRAGLDAAAAQGVPQIFLIEHDYELALKEAELRWVRDLIRGIQEEALTGVDWWRGFHAQGGAHRDDERREEEPVSN
ncbi:MAG: PadR family transcriptional regulator [Sphaerobacter sp.]|nr:PadR family transcriptional regulator [Sphaerobacter sp.]